MSARQGGGSERLVGGLTNSMAVARASVDKVTHAAIDNTKAVAATSSELLHEASSTIKTTTADLPDEDIRKQTVKSFKKGSVMGTKGLNKVKQMTLDMAGAQMSVGLPSCCLSSRPPRADRAS